MPERYDVTILNGETVVRTLPAAGPHALYAATDQIADFGTLPAAFHFAVAQVSPVLGAGHRAQGAFHG